MIATTPNESTPASSSSIWWQRIDDWCERVGDAMNPILIKETRQALKSRQFVVTFSALLFAALGWTIIGSLTMMPEIYTSPSAPRMLTGYYVVLALPLLLVVPLAAYRSLECEIDDGTLELLSISALSPWQIVLGKLASATLQMVLYFVALLPCVAYAYTLRGVDLPTTLLMIGILIASALLLTVIALFFAPIARGRTGRIGTLLSVMGILLMAEYGIGAMVIYMIWWGNPLTTEWVVFLTIAVIMIGVCLGHLLLTATAAMLTPESENRSTPIRLSLLMLTSVSVGLAAYDIHIEDGDGIVVLLFLAIGLTAIWTVCGSMMVGESSVTTPRIRRELPSSFLARTLLTWITPGPNTGLVFATSVGVLLAAFVLAGLEYSFRLHPNLMRGGARFRVFLFQFTIMYTSYFVGFLICVRMIMGVLRIRNNPRAEIGLAAMVVVIVLAALIPYGVGLHINDYREFEYTHWQLTNWIWTMSEIVDGRFSSGAEYWVASTVAAMFGGCLLFMPRIVMPRKIATPARVEQELANQ